MTAVTLPTDRAVLIYDMDCGFCTTSARWIERRWRRAPVPVLVGSQQLDDDTLVAVGLSRARVTQEACWVDGDVVCGGADAIAASLAAAGGWPGQLGRIMRLPGLIQLGRLVYPAVARHRHRMPGATDACRLPTSADDDTP